jgi:hypothetical protein
MDSLSRYFPFRRREATRERNYPAAPSRCEVFEAKRAKSGTARGTAACAAVTKDGGRRRRVRVRSIAQAPAKRVNNCSAAYEPSGCTSAFRLFGTRESLLEVLAKSLGGRPLPDGEGVSVEELLLRWVLAWEEP